MATPWTFCRYASCPEGGVYGYEAAEWDNCMARMMSLSYDNNFKGLKFTGASGPRGDGYSESLITGEADAIAKAEGDELKSGSFVIAGRCKAQLTKVGNDSFAAKLSAEAKANPQATKSEMMRSLDSLIRIIGFALIPVGIAMIAQGVV